MIALQSIIVQSLPCFNLKIFCLSFRDELSDFPPTHKRFVLLTRPDDFNTMYNDRGVIQELNTLFSQSHLFLISSFFSIYKLDKILYTTFSKCLPFVVFSFLFYRTLQILWKCRWSWHFCWHPIISQQPL